MIRIHIVCLLFIALIIAAFRSSAQTTDPSPVEHINVIPPAPNAASLGKYGDVPVGYYTGVPSIKVPLFNIVVKDFQLPVELNYHAGGFKVEERASWVGYGWSLGAGGVITRTVRGLPDELSDGNRLGYNLAREEIKKYDNNIYTGQQRLYFQQMLADGNWDGEPDQYYFNFNGRSGTIVYDMNGNPLINPGQDLKVEGTIESDITITDEKGIVYMFSGVERTEEQDGCALLPVPEFASSLYLTSIVFPSGDNISFAYAGGVTYVDVVPHSSLYQFVTGSIPSACTSIGGSPCKRSYRIQTLRLVSITHGKTEVQFNAITQRTDLPQYSQEYRLDNVELRYNNTVSRQFVLSYSTYSCARLKLDSIAEISGALRKPAYAFEYYGGLTPCFEATGQDFWGYYNGKNNSTLVPAGSFVSTDGRKVFLSGADRRPTADAINGLLKRITYPTGGSTSFQYEQNDYGHINSTQIQDPMTEPASVTVLASPGNPSHVEVFTLGTEQDLNIEYGVNQLNGGLYPTENEYVELRRTSDNSILATRTFGTGVIQLPLAPGTYQLLAYSENSQTSTYASVTYQRSLEGYRMTRPGPGIRIATIIDENGVESGKAMYRRFNIPYLVNLAGLAV